MVVVMEEAEVMAEAAMGEVVVVVVAVGAKGKQEGWNNADSIGLLEI